jgi:predicted amidohydrolase YtcJ
MNPMPREPPVTTAVFPASENIRRIGSAAASSGASGVSWVTVGSFVARGWRRAYDPRRTLGLVDSPADLVITGARVWTSGPAGVRDAALGIRDGRVVGVAEEAELRDRLPGAEVLHLPGRLVVPGFTDAHVHPPFAGRDLGNVWLHDLGGREEYLAIVGAYAADHPDAPWILGGGWAMEHFPGGTPHKRDLDTLVPDRPVFLFNRDVHGAWVNSRALELAGIDRDTPDPADGRIERDPGTGEPTGMLHEGAAYTLNERLVPPPTTADWEAGLLRAQAHLHSLGITGWQDAWVTPATQTAYESLAASGRLTARVVGSLWWERSEGIEQVESLLSRREAAARAAAGGFHATTVKIMLDGVLENGTGALLEPYCDGCGGHTANSGISFVAPEDLAAAVTRLDAEGFQVHMHAIGDRAVRDALDAVQAARDANGAGDHRHHVAHIQVIQPGDVPRFGRLGVVANCQAFWAQSEPQMDDLTIPFLGPERTGLQYPFASLRRTGATLAMGSDWAVTTADPLAQIEVAVNRAGPNRREVPAFLPDERLSLEEALTAFTAGSAYVNHDDEGGAIAPGRRADLAVLAADLHADGAPPIADAKVELTLAAGKVVHGA